MARSANKENNGPPFWKPGVGLKSPKDLVVEKVAHTPIIVRGQEEIFLRPGRREGSDRNGIRFRKKRPSPIDHRKAKLQAGRFSRRVDVRGHGPNSFCCVPFL